jgi:cardiolipin synthase (CMP-forming)
MNLHRTNGQPEWVSVEPSGYNLWQRVAAATHGYVTPGNMTTLCGLVLVMIGLVHIVAEEYWLGGVLVVIGRLLDLVDGWLADITHTKSPLGEIADAGADKIETFAAIAVLFAAALAPWWLLVALILPHVGIAIIAYIARTKNVQLHPSRLGKISMALLWVALFGFIIVKGVDSGALSGVVYGVAVVSVLTTLYAAAGYAMSLMRKTY